MGLRSRTVEVTVICGENVRVEEEACVVVRAESLKCCTTKMAKGSELCDKAGNNGGSTSSFLCWNDKLLLHMPLHARSITFEVHNNNSKGFRPAAGVARIAVSDLLGGGGGGCPHGNNSLKVFSYRLRDWEGRRNGVIHFTVRAVPEERTVEPGKVAKDEEKKDASEVVVGVPFWWNYPNNII